VLSAADVEYIRGGFVELDELCSRHARDPLAVRAEIDAGLLPRPSYVLDDGVEMVPADYFGLADQAGGVDRLREAFLRRYALAAAAEPEPLAAPEEEWQAYLSGEYGVCLREVTPENIVRKSALVERIEAMLAAPDPRHPDWAGRLRGAVEELDALEREFAAFDRIRFGGPSSRDRLITGARNRYPSIFAREVVRS
jgi:Family of unknown function (DUF6058)